MIEVTREQIQLETVFEKVRKNGCGAIFNFIGTVRDNSNGKRVLYLEYDAYPEMATKKLADIAVEIKDKWDIVDVAITHRLGRMEIGETAVVIAVSSAHRRPAFAACQYAIDRIKEIVPIWKKEYYEEGSAWIGSDSHREA